MGATGEPAFNKTSFCNWSNFDAFHNTAAFYKDQFGVVHLKGLVKLSDESTTGICSANATVLTVFQLPEGYRPATREVHATISNEQLGRVNVDAADGRVSAGTATPNSVTNAKAWLSLDGITFRAAN